MVELSEKMKELINEDPDIKIVLETFTEIKTIYDESLAANMFNEELPAVMNSAEVKLKNGSFSLSTK